MNQPGYFTFPVDSKDSIAMPNTPTRPSSIPAGAEFVEASSEWALGPHDSHGRRTGQWLFWRQDGTLSEESMFDAGQLHGTKRRFYEDGRVATEEHHERGLTLWILGHRPACDTAVPHPFGSLHGSVQTCKFLYTPDGFIRHQRAFTADGIEVSPEGVAAPPRPPGVPDHANFLTTQASSTVYVTAGPGDTPVQRKVESHAPRQYWEVSEYTIAEGKCVERGVTRTYLLTGELETVRFGDAWVRSAPAAQPKDRLGQGNPLIAAAQAGDEAAVELLFALGLHQSPGAALHAALEGLPALARRILDDQSPPAFTDRREAQRPAGLPVSAAWVPGLDAFVEGRLTADGRADGIFRLWKGSARQPSLTEITFADGRRSRQVDTKQSKATEQIFFTTGPHQGQVQIERRWVDGLVKAETEFWPGEDKIAQRVFDEHGQRVGERVEAAGVLVQETWWKDGSRVATVVPHPESLDAEEEHYRGFDGDTLVAEGPTKAGLEGSPQGVWSVYEDSRRVGDAPFDRLGGLASRVGKRDAHTFAGKLWRWSRMPTPEALADILALDWRDRRGWFSTDKELLPFLLTGLAFGDPEVFDLALDGLRDDVLHQSTLSEASGPVLTTILRLLPQATARSQALMIDFLCDVVRDCGDKLINLEAVGEGTVLALMHRTSFERLAAALGKDTEAGRQAGELGAWAADRFAQVTNALERVRSTQDPDARVEQLFAVRPLLRPDDLEHLLDDPDALVRFWASHFCNAAKQPRAIDVWRDTLRQLDALEPRFQRSPHGKSGLAVYLVKNLSNVFHMRPEVRDDLPLAIAALGKVPPDVVPYFVECACGLAFGQCELPFAADFMDWLGALADSKLLAEDAAPPAGGAGHEGIDRMAVQRALKKFGLPSAQDGLETLLATLRSAPATDAALRAYMHGETSSDRSH